MEVSASLGRLLKRLREGRGWTLAQAGERLGMSRSYVFQVESGARNPKRATLRKFAETYGVGEEQLYQAAEGIELVETGVDERIERITANLLTMRELDAAEIDRVAVVVQAMTEDLKRRRKEEDDAERRRRASQQS
jgi:transcriptional regulator with XRE-family HTH domain